MIRSSSKAINMRKSFFRQKRKLVAETSSLKHEIQELMDAPIYYEWLIDVIPSHDATPNECQLAEAKQNEMMKLYGEKAKATIYFRENSKQLKNLIDEYKKNQNVETRAFPESVNFCRLVEEMEENNEFEESEENEKTEVQVESPAKNSRTLYLKFKQPLQAFKRDLNKLDEEARSILIENNEALNNGIDSLNQGVHQLVDGNKQVLQGLTQLDQQHPGITNVHVDVKEQKGEIEFRYRVVEGKADKSYGINVARLAHLPKVVLDRANQLLRDFESQGVSQDYQPSLFVMDQVEPKKSEIMERLQNLDVDSMTPRDAQDFLYELKKLADAIEE